MRSLRILLNKIQDNIISNLVDLISTPGDYTVSHLNTGYLIQILASLDEEKISEWQFKSKNKCPDLNKKISITAKLCMDGYIRSIDQTIESYHSITVWLDACLYMLRDFLADRSIHNEYSQFWEENAALLFEIIKKPTNIRKISTVDLSRFAKSLSLLNKTGIIANDGDVLTESVLELLYRRNKFGFFCFSAHDQSILPLSKQFFILDCLIECHQSTMLEVISHIALEIYNNLCSIARKTPTGHFTFRSGETISYSAESIGNIFMGVSALFSYLEEINQRKSTEHMLNELYFKLLLSRLMDKKSTAINVTNCTLLLKNDIATHISESLNSMFANRILLNFSEQSIKYIPHRRLNGWQTLYLCRCLLDVDRRMQMLPKKH